MYVTSLHNYIHMTTHDSYNCDVLDIGHSHNEKEKPKILGHLIYHRYHIRAKAKNMVKKNDARIERLEKAHQDTQEIMEEMIEILKTLVREKGQATCPGQQSSVVHPDQRREKPAYPPRFTPL